MISRSLFRKFIVHPTLILFFVIAFITGTFIQFAIIISIVLIHELGHFVAARYFKWRINSVVLWAFGGVMITDEQESRPIKEEVIVTLAGPFQHVIIFVLIQILTYFNLFTSNILDTASFFNVIILLFNLLPIYPLDGGKLCKSLLSLFVPFRSCYQYVLIFSWITCLSIIVLQITILPFTFSALFIMIFLIIEIYRHWKNEYITFIRFLLNRLANEQRPKKIARLYVSEDDRLIDLFNQFKRNVFYYIYITPDHYVSETDSLKRYFYDKKHSETVKEIYGK